MAGWYMVELDLHEETQSVRETMSLVAKQLVSLKFLARDFL